ncbi:hypothetical protein DL771_001016 [Monosporascus sp. 5C6A]|nr:hypothetical protein DL771_001016 [Monosporascus sp. 5C6A]
MAEILGIVSSSLGLLPILVEVVRGYRTIRRAVSAAKACTKELESINIDLEVQEGRFINECALIVQCASPGDNEARVMIRDPEHPRWGDEKLETSITGFLSRSHSLCIAIINGMTKTHQELRKDLEAFDLVRSERKKDESLKAAFRRIRQSLKVPYERSKLEDAIDRLRKGNEDLEALRNQLCNLRNTSGCVSVSARKPWRRMPGSIQETHQISLEVHKALVGTFSCKEAAHLEHWAALGIEAEPGNKNGLDLALSYLATNDSLRNETTLKLRLRSYAIPTRGLRKREVTTGGAYKVQKRQRFADEDEEHDDNDDDSALENAKYDSLSLPVDLVTIENTCSYLETHCRIGLRIALKAALAVLKFYSTPWLGDYWQTSQLHLPISAQSTSHHPRFFLRSRLPEVPTIADSSVVAPASNDAVMANMPEPYSQEEIHGINNKTLWSLGTALLEIGHWRPLDELCRAGGPNDIPSIRRIARRKTALGGKYDEIIQKCLQCNFGCKTDLAELELQEAVYNTVICPLQSFITKLEAMDL